MSDHRLNTRLAVLAVLAFAIFNYPILRLFDVETIVLGVPLVWLYVFTAWGLLIAVVGFTVRKR